MALTLISGPDELSYTRNPINVIVELEADPEFEDVYALCHVYDASANLLATLFARPNENYYVDFEISSILNSFTNFSPVGFTDLSVHYLTTDFTLGYWCRVEQYSNGSIINGLDIGKVGFDIVLFAIKGGLAIEKLSIDIFSHIASNKMFLTWLKQSKVTKSQPYYLYYLHLQESETIIAKAKVVYSDESTQTHILIDFGDVDKYDLLKISTGYDHQKLGDLSPGKTPVHYEIWVENGAGALRAGHFRFYLIDTYVPFPRSVTYGNSLGGFDFILLKGNINHEIEPSNSELVRTTGIGKLSYGFDHLVQKTVTASTGYISKYQMQTLTDLFTSRMIFEIIGNQAYQVKVSTRTKHKYNETDNLISLQFEYTRIASNRNFTPDVTG
jgi:hypothetical protein